jgi:hypothetical protein
MKNEETSWAPFISMPKVIEVIAKLNPSFQSSLA